MNLAYIRVSTIDQNEARQYEALKPFDIKKYFVDKVSARTLERPALMELLDYARAGDILFCSSLDRLGRNLAHLKQITEQLLKKGVKIHFVKENLVFDENITPMGNLVFNVMSSFAEFEREYLRERQAEGIALAKKAGKFKGRKPTKINDEVKKNIEFMLQCGQKVADICRAYCISRTTFYKYIHVSKTLTLKGDQCGN